MAQLEGSNGGFSVEIDDHGNILSFASGDTALGVPLHRTHYEINGSAVRLGPSKVAGAFLLEDAGTGATLQSQLIFEADGELTARIAPGPDSGSDAAGRVENWSVTLALPLEAEFHLPEYSNIGRRLDKSMPLADFYGTRTFYNFCLVGCNGVWLRFLSEQRRVGRLGVHVERLDEMFLLTVTWNSARDDAGGLDRCAFSLDGRIGVFGSMEEAMTDYDRYLAEEVGVTERACGNTLPAWIDKTRLSVSLDLMRCYGEIVNTYRDIAQIARDLKQEGAPPDTIVHVVGFNGPFDTTYPTHRPIEALGGEQGFREMVDAVHECGFRFSVHVNGCCIDPHHPDIEDLMPMVLRDADGKPVGYKLSPDKTPPSRRIRFSTDKIPLTQKDARRAVVEVDCPALCESMVTIGGLSAATGGVAVTINERTHRIPAGSNLEEYRIPYPMHLNTGPNSIELSSGSDIDWTDAWFRVDVCFVPNFVHAIGTIPILMADTTNDDFISLFCDEVESLVTTYGVDLVYIDYTTFYHPNGSQKLFAGVCERLPNTPIAVEWSDTIEELGWAAFCGGSKHHLVKGSPKLYELAGRKQVPVSRGIIERYDWLDQSSPVCDFVKRYRRYRGGGSFVPLNWVASLYDDYLIFGDPTELREILDGAERLNFIPSLQLNYQKYGIDEHAKRFIRDLSKSADKAARG